MIKLFELIVENNRLLLQGEIDFHNVMSAYTESIPFLKEKLISQIDLTHLTTTTKSAIIALLVEWIKYAKTYNVKLKFVNIPKQLHAIISAAELDSFFDTAAAKKIS